MVKLFNLSYYLVDGVARLILIGHGWYFVITFRVFFGGYWTKRDIPEYYLVCSSEARAKSLMTLDFQISLVFEELLYESLPVWFEQSQRPFRQGILKEPHKDTLFMDIDIRLQFLHHRAELTSIQGIEQTFIHFFFNVHKNGFV